MQYLHALISDPQTVIDLPPEELAGIMIKFFNEQTDINPDALFQRTSVCGPQSVFMQNYPQSHRIPLQRALTGAWVWLEREGLIAPDPSQSSSVHMYVTKRGRTLKSPTDVEAYRKVDLLPRAILHPLLTIHVLGAFIRGDYEGAVSQTLKEVEIAVREAGGYTYADTGSVLMQKAFNDTTGPLTDKDQEINERKALANLFGGMMGYYRNPLSHRRVPMDAEEAVECLTFASRLLKIVDERRPSTP